MPSTPTSRITIQEIPDSTPAAELIHVLNSRFRDLQESLKGVVEKKPLEDIDAGAKRVVNMGDPTDDMDAVNLRALKKFGGRRQADEQEEAIAAETPQHFGVIFTKDGFVTDEEESPWWTVDTFREGSPIAALITAKGAPDGESLKVNWEVLRVGAIDTELLLDLPLEIPVGEFGPTYSDLGLLITDRLPKGTRINMLIVQGGDAEKVVGQIVFARS